MFGILLAAAGCFWLYRKHEPARSWMKEAGHEIRKNFREGKEMGDRWFGDR